jgi:hypothetical protein
MNVCTDSGLPLCWVVGAIDGEMWVVPAVSGGWKQRRRYAVPPGGLRDARLSEAAPSCSLNGGLNWRLLGLPEAVG